MWYRYLESDKVVSFPRGHDHPRFQILGSLLMLLDISTADSRSLYICDGHGHDSQMNSGARNNSIERHPLTVGCSAYEECVFLSNLDLQHGDVLLGI